jgi:hypothetical protein
MCWLSPPVAVATVTQAVTLSLVAVAVPVLTLF